MNAIDKTILDSDVSLGRLLDAIGGARDLPMILSHDGRPMKGAYRLAGVKVGHRGTRLRCQAQGVVRNFRAAVGH